MKNKDRVIRILLHFCVLEILYSVQANMYCINYSLLIRRSFCFELKTKKLLSLYSVIKPKNLRYFQITRNRLDSKFCNRFNCSLIGRKLTGAESTKLIYFYVHIRHMSLKAEVMKYYTSCMLI